jgi:hypothetical protein
MPNTLLILKTKLTNKSDKLLLLNSPKLWTSTENSSMTPLKTDKDSKKNFNKPKTTLLGTNLDKTRSTERWKSSSITNVTATNFSLDQSKWTKNVLKLSPSWNKMLLVTLLPDNHSNSPNSPRLTSNPWEKNSRCTPTSSHKTKSNHSSN